MISPNNQVQLAMIAVNIHGGKEAAMAYPVSPGHTVFLLDEESNMFFIKKNDAVGMQMSLREFKFKEVTPREFNGNDSSKYATKEDFNILLAEIKKLQGHHSSYNPKQRRNNNGQHYAKSDV